MISTTVADELLGAVRGFFMALPGVTQAFIIVIAAGLVYFHVRYNPRTATLGPTLLTTTGIFATFLGIALGLYRFDTANVQASIPSLLAGLKTAFWASVFGVGAAITLKLREFFFGFGGQADQIPAADDITAADLVRHLREIREALTGGDDGSLISQIKLARQDTNERLAPLRDIQRGLVGAEDGSLITQLRLLRQDTNDRLDAVRAAMTEALHKLSEMGSKALIEALRDVIREFNEKLTEQFGENFRELNSAVGRLLVWQENYKSTIETTVVRLDEVIRLVSKVSEDFQMLVERSGRFAQVAENLGSLMTALEAGERRLKDVSEGLATLLLKASGSLPEIERKVLELATQMADAVRESQRTVSAAMTESTTAFRAAVEALRRDIGSLSTQLSSSVTESHKVVGAALTENAAAVRTAILSAQQDMTKTNVEFNRQLAELASKTKEQVATLDVALATELTKSLESLAKQFTALSQRFASDYGPLADRLKQIVELARVP